MNDYEQQLCGIFAGLAKNADRIAIQPDTRIEALDLDSLDVLDALMQIQKTFEVDIPYERFSHLPDIQAIAREVQAGH